MWETPNRLFERIRCGEMHEPESHKIVDRTLEDIRRIIT